VLVLWRDLIGAQHAEEVKIVDAGRLPALRVDVRFGRRPREDRDRQVGQRERKALAEGLRKGVGGEGGRGRNKRKDVHFVAEPVQGRLRQNMHTTSRTCLLRRNEW